LPIPLGPKMQAISLDFKENFAWTGRSFANVLVKSMSIITVASEPSFLSAFKWSGLVGQFAVVTSNSGKSFLRAQHLFHVSTLNKLPTVNQVFFWKRSETSRPRLSNNEAMERKQMDKTAMH